MRDSRPFNPRSRQTRGLSLSIGVAAGLSIALLWVGHTEAKPTPPLHPYVVQHGFSGADGSTPIGVVEDALGNEYGTTLYGGCPAGQACGVLYKIDTTGEFKILVYFGGASGAFPWCKLVVKGDKIYGTAGNGGLFNKGVVFSVRTDGTHYKLLHSFGGADGWEPTGDIAMDASGNIYGTTDVGGAGFSVQNAGDGVLYEVEPDGTFLQLHDFTAAVDGKAPSGVVLDTAGNLYGNTLFGPGAVAGSVYKFSPATAALTTLVVFPYGGESTPYVSWAAPNGNVFGYLNSYPEQSGHLGQLFVLANSDSGYRYEVLHTFTGGSDGAYPVGMTLSGPHQIIGLTRNGALTKKPQGRGTIFSYDNNTFTTLFNIGGPAANGTNPNAAPFVTDTGVILGTTAIGGPTCSLMANGCGVTFQYTP